MSIFHPRAFNKRARNIRVINEYKLPGRPKNARLYMIAVEFLTTPVPRPWGLMTHLATANGHNLSQVCAAIQRIKNAVKGKNRL